MRPWRIAITGTLMGLMMSLLMTSSVMAQVRHPFWQDIQAFKKQDSASFPPKNAILFIGSSSFTMWKDVSQDFPNHTIINRGFGGSTLADQIRYVDDIVFPYEPKQVVIYCGENDLASADTITANVVMNRFAKLFSLIRNRLSSASIVFVSMKPSPSRQLIFRKLSNANDKIRKFLARKKNTAYVDIYKEMIDDEGRPRGELFLEDNLHMNRQGYQIWQKAIEPYLLK